MLEGFVKIPIFKGTVFMSVSKGVVSFSGKSVLLMQKASFVNFLVNEEDKKIAIQKCNKGSGDAISFCRSEKSFKNGVHLHNFEIAALIAEMMGWDLEKFYYRIDGEFSEEDQAMIFDLNFARQFNRKGRKRKNAEVTEN